MTEPTLKPGQDQPEETIGDQANAVCAEFQASMPQRIGDGEDLQSHPHMQTCERCRALVYELEEIAQAARLLFPVEAEPDEDLWTKIEKKLTLEDSPPAEAETANRSDESPGIALDRKLAFEGGMA